MNCLNEGQLLSLPRCDKIHQLPKVLKARNWRILFYSNLAYILGWKKKRHFPDEIFKVVRELWLDENEQSSVNKRGCLPSCARPTAHAIAYL